MTIPVKPMLCTPQKEFYLDKFNDDWTAEVKYDGERIIAEQKDGDIYLWTRRENEVSVKFPELVSGLSGAMPRSDWIIDGELTVEGGFEKVLKRNTNDSIAIKVLARDLPATLHVFDLIKTKEYLCLDNATLAERREILDAMVKKNANVEIAHRCKGTKAKQLFDMVTHKDGEGVVVKKLDSKYVSGFRSPYWFKIKKLETVDVEVIGCTQCTTGTFPFGSVVIARKGKYYGKIGTGFTSKGRREIIEKITNNPDDKDFSRWQVPPEVKREMIRVCAPLPAEMKMLEECSTGMPRHPVWVRWRE